jgi:hypothetical protein
VVTGGVRPPKSLDGPLIASARVLRPVSCVERCGTVCAPGMVMSNSFPVAWWQTTQTALDWGPMSPLGPWLVPGGPACVGTLLGFTSSWQPVHADGEGLFR